MPRGASGERVFLDENGVLDAHLSEMIQGAAADHSAADDHNVGRRGQSAVRLLSFVNSAKHNVVPKLRPTSADNHSTQQPFTFVSSFLVPTPK